MELSQWQKQQKKNLLKVRTDAFKAAKKECDALLTLSQVEFSTSKDAAGRTITWRAPRPGARKTRSSAKAQEEYKKELKAMAETAKESVGNLRGVNNRILSNGGPKDTRVLSFLQTWTNAFKRGK